MGPFHLESVAAGGDRAVLRIDGDIDACTAPQLRERVLDLAGTGTVHVIADLRGVGFLDSAGLGALVAARKELRGRAGVAHAGGRDWPDRAGVAGHRAQRRLRAAFVRPGGRHRRPELAGGRLSRRP